MWVMQYNTVLLIKKIFYIHVIVAMQQSGLYQSIAVALQSSIFCVYLVVQQPLSKIDDLRKALVTEAGMFLNSLSFILYSVNQQFQFNQETLFYLGWINIGTYTIIVSSNLLIDGFAQFKIVYAKIKKAFNNFIQSQLPQQSRIQPIFI
ncbi:unnamed protein product [Paramecium octaurelia]|uniref:Transmembrane protein n=1 Tax=Paramecium octaurelia TaxID=43137 RepID=A0A8S1U2T1_PAROT|nr:unnamed protein product [Paramecium octaurelia]